MQITYAYIVIVISQTTADKSVAEVEVAKTSERLAQAERTVAQLQSERDELTASVTALRSELSSAQHRVEQQGA